MVSTVATGGVVENVANCGDTDYYAERLSGARLERCYEIAPARVRQYLDCELEFALKRIQPGDRVLELGCGYGRILPALAEKAALVVGIDTSGESLQLAGEKLAPYENILLVQMSAAELLFPERSFDLVICIQNGVSAFHVERRRLIEESLRVIRPGGRALFSSYSARFWEDRLDWFRLQSQEGLLGEIDEEKTGAGVIVCKDGFTANAVGEKEFRQLTSGSGADVKIHEVDESSLFCEMIRD